MAAAMVKTKTPGVYKRGSRYVEVWNYRGTQHKKSHRTYAEARESKARRQAGERRPESRDRFGDYFGEWIESYAGRTARGFSETTRPEYRRPIEAHALPAWESWRLTEVEPADVRDLFARMRTSGATTSAIKKLRAALSAMFATAVEDGKIRSNPVQGVRIPASKVAEPEADSPKALTRSELRLLLDAMPSEWRLFFEFLSQSGLRISEAVGLQWKHLDLGENPHVQVREQFYKGERKGLKSRSGRRDVPLSPGLRERLLELRRDNFREDAPVFASKAGTELLPANVYRRVLAPAAVSLGHFVEVEGSGGRPRKRSTVSFHTFRHTCASMLFEAGRNVKQVSEWLGHADAGFTLRTYVHLMDDGVGDAGFFDSILLEEGGNKVAIEHPQTAGNSAEAENLKVAY